MLVWSFITWVIDKSGVIDAHRSQRRCPLFNSLFDFYDRGAKTHTHTLREYRQSVSPSDKNELINEGMNR